MPCLKSINLSHNGITDEFDREILELFDNSQITNLDLSNNKMKRLGHSIGKKLKEGNCVHIKWIDLTQNDFTLESIPTGLIVAGLKR
jgi:Ran GTPase-activating protein (RanGAP) involved in mRNA processing and transport